MKCFSLLLALLAALLAPPAAAQQSGSQAAPSDLNLPSWAAPAQRQAYQPPTAATDAPPDFPGAPQVPVDGGLVWLGLAGGAYAVRRLRRSGGPVEV